MRRPSAETLEYLKSQIVEGKIKPGGLKQEVLVAIATSLIASGRERGKVSNEVLEEQLERLKDKRQKSAARRSLPGLIGIRIRGG